MFPFLYLIFLLIAVAIVLGVVNALIPLDRRLNILISGLIALGVLVWAFQYMGALPHH